MTVAKWYSFAPLRCWVVCRAFRLTRLKSALYGLKYWVNVKFIMGTDKTVVIRTQEAKGCLGNQSTFRLFGKEGTS